MEPFHEYLRTHREKRGIRLEEIASITKIHLRSLQLMESGQWHELPPEPFIRGFLIAYAKYVGIEPRDALERFYAENGGTENGGAPVVTDPSEATYASEVIEHSHRVPLRIIAAGAALVMVFAVVGTLVYIGQTETTTTTTTAESTPTTETEPRAVAAADPAAQSAAAPAAPVAAGVTLASPSTAAGAPSTTVATSAPVVEAPAVLPTPAQLPLPAGVAHAVDIEVAKRTWMKVVLDGEKPQEMILEPGDKRSYQAKNKFKAVIANPEGAKIVHNGQMENGIAVRGGVKSFRFPAQAQFPQDMPAPKPQQPAAEPKAEEAAAAPSN